jgi:hypothetical protein|tara:strand:+ start:8157 stop:8477 length:321 start_codon:yes stop_codon:yes gene_type:complete
MKWTVWINLKIFGYGNIGNRNFGDDIDLCVFPAHHIPLFLRERKFQKLAPQRFYQKAERIKIDGPSGKIGETMKSCPQWSSGFQSSKIPKSFDNPGGMSIESFMQE